MSEKSQSNCLLELEQVLPIGENTLTVSRTELTKSDFDSFTLIVETTGNSVLVNNLFENPSLIRGQKLKCRYDGTIATATLELLTKQEFGLSLQRKILHFVCGEIEADQKSGDLYEFLIPYGHFGQGDHSTRIDKGNGGWQQIFDYIKFDINGVESILRHLIEIDGVFYPADEAIRVQQEAGVENFHLNACGHVALQVKTDTIERPVAEKTASDICWLLHLALGQRVAWAELRMRAGRDATFLCRRAFAFPKKMPVAQPIRNWTDGRIKQFIETGWPVFQRDAQWWREALNWYSVAAEMGALESSSMIYCMLFDRLSSHLLKSHEFPKQISDELATSLNDRKKRDDLIDSITTVGANFAGKEMWTAERSKALVNQIELWNNAPSYPNKVAKAFEMVRLKAPSKKMLKLRHSLMHEGGLKLQSEEALEFLCELHQSIVSLMLSMLGYNGKFFSMGRGECEMSTLMLEAASPQTSILESAPKSQPEP